MKLIADTHTHTVACDHAYSTVDDNARIAAERGLKYLAVTEHAPNLPGAPGTAFFWNLPILPVEIDGVKILKGVELNILDTNGTIDLDINIVKNLDWVIASFHYPTFAPATSKEHTKAWLNIAENPDIDVIGHCGDSRFIFDFPKVIKAFKDNNKIVEINTNSFPTRPGSKENCREIARLCAEYGVNVVINSDAHYCKNIGSCAAAIEMLEEIKFPEELIINTDVARFEKALAAIKLK